MVAFQHGLGGIINVDLGLRWQALRTRPTDIQQRAARDRIVREDRRKTHAQFEQEAEALAAMIQMAGYGFVGTNVSSGQHYESRAGRNNATTPHVEPAASTLAERDTVHNFGQRPMKGFPFDLAPHLPCLQQDMNIVEDMSTEVTPMCNTMQHVLHSSVPDSSIASCPRLEISEIDYWPGPSHSLTSLSLSTSASVRADLALGDRIEGRATSQHKSMPGPVSTSCDSSSMLTSETTDKIDRQGTSKDTLASTCTNQGQENYLRDQRSSQYPRKSERERRREARRAGQRFESKYRRLIRDRVKGWAELESIEPKRQYAFANNAGLA